MGPPKKKSSRKRRAETELPFEDHKRRAETIIPDEDDNYRTFRLLLTVIHSPRGIKPPALKSLYLLLVRLSSRPQWNVKCTVDSDEFDLEIYHDGIKVAFGDVCGLSDVLFQELTERSKQFLALSENPASKKLGQLSSHLDLLEAAEILKLLLRCCIVLLTLLVAKQHLLLEKGLVLLGILRQLSLPCLVNRTANRAFKFEKSVCHESAHGDGDCTTSYAEGFTASVHILEPSNLHRFFQSTMLEVFLDELSIHGQLRHYFKLIDSFAATGEKLFDSRSSQGDIGIVMEVICTHFFLSFSEELAFEDFLSGLFGIRAKELGCSFRFPEISLIAAVSLLHNPIIVSAPKYMKAHLICLISEVDNMMDIERLKPDCKLMNCFLSIFEKSVILYTKHMSSLGIDGYSQSGIGSDKQVHSSLESYVSLETKHKIDALISKLDDSCNVKLDGIFIRMKSDLVSSAMRFVKEIQTVLEAPFRDDIFAVLSSLILKASESFDETAINLIECLSLEDIYLLASLLKLMSTSLVQVVHCLRQSQDLCHTKTLKEFSSCKEYDFILGIISTFRNFSLHPSQQVLFNEIFGKFTEHKVSGMMFLHFSGLMSLSFASGIDCLVKGCLWTIIAVLYLFVFEDGSLDELQSMVEFSKESLSSGLLHVKFQETIMDQNSSLVVASKFQKIRTLCLRNSSIANSSDEMGDLSTPNMDGAIEETEETTNGEIFFKCVSAGGAKMSDFDNLTDFVECEKGKDYSAWLKNRYRFRKWKCERMAVLKWKKKKKTWRATKRKRIGTGL